MLEHNCLVRFLQLGDLMIFLFLTEMNQVFIVGTNTSYGLNRTKRIFEL
jgi:hypothetical protein